MAVVDFAQKAEANATKEEEETPAEGDTQNKENQKIQWSITQHFAVRVKSELFCSLWRKRATPCVDRPISVSLGCTLFDVLDEINVPALHNASDGHTMTFEMAVEAVAS